MADRADRRRGTTSRECQDHVNAHEMPSNLPLAFSSREDVERLCIENLLTAAEERVFFKDLEGRYIMVSAGWLAAEAGGRALEDVIGKTDFDIFAAAYAQASREDEQHVIASGNAVVAKVQRQTYDGREPAWVATTRVPLRSRDGGVIGTFGTTRDVTAEVEVQDALTYRALHDPLTGLVNRVALIDRLSQALVGLERRPGWVGVLFIDLDGFKAVNDTLGHEAGDEVLIEAGRRLTQVARKTDTVARLGGDELVVLCAELRESQCVELIAERALRAMRPPLTGPAASLPFAASIGAACTSDPELTPAELLHQADLAMYAAKRAGGDSFAVYDPEHHRRARVAASVPAPTRV
jgi:diguanylate cyclase (GGDEF)-like protein/PAS domain S-box-containing protein